VVAHLGHQEERQGEHHVELEQNDDEVELVVAVEGVVPEQVSGPDHERATMRV
jgi:hypothetical protein